MNITYRTAIKDDCQRIAELDYIASGGASEFLFHDLIEGASAIDIVAHGLEDESSPHSYQNAIIAEDNGHVIGMAFSFPASLHGITDEMTSFIPADRLAFFSDFFSARVDDSYYLDAICVDQAYRSKGIGEQLLFKTMEKASKKGFNSISLMVFADNLRAIAFYQAHGFHTVREVHLEEHPLIQHKGGCLLMLAPIIEP